MAVGVEVTGVWHRLLGGTGESCIAMLNGKIQAYKYASMKVGMSSTGAEEFVVVGKLM
ncbi:hypothetical protein [Bacillus sp. B1-b2]|uniref:hypothetical protein n=1 Tax=Bacillaceae TaxID=186817 RepID=UPI001869EA2E|nr:hypothetical protein [Bacillus sp. B1-b2]